MSLNCEVDAGMLIEELRVSLDRRLLIGAHIRLVVVEIDILDVLIEQLRFRKRRRRRRRRWWRLRYREARGRLLRSAGTFRRQVIGCRGAGRNLLRSAGLNRANAVDRHVGRV